MGEVAIALGVVDAVADDEPVGDLEAEPFGFDFGLTAAGLGEQGADFHAARVARLEDFENVLKCMSGIDNIFDNQNVPTGDLAAQVLENADFPARFRGISIGLGFEEIDFDRQVELAD
jgi:hypothetical protein